MRGKAAVSGTYLTEKVGGSCSIANRTNPRFDSLRHVVCLHSYGDFTIGIVLVSEKINPTAFVAFIHQLFEVRMFGRDVLNLIKHSRKIFVSAENQNSRLCVTPAKVRKHLIERLEVTLFAGPKFTLSYEDVSPVDLDEKVRLAFIVEGFARRIA